MDTWVTQLRKGVLELCVLNLLSNRENYGYELVQQLRSVLDLEVRESTVYPILTRLRRDGYLKVRAVPSPDGPPRRYFSLSENGRLRLTGMNTRWDSLVNVIESLREG